MPGTQQIDRQLLSFPGDLIEPDNAGFDQIERLPLGMRGRDERPFFDDLDRGDRFDSLQFFAVEAVEQVDSR